MRRRSIENLDISAVSEALGIAEEKTGNFYKFSSGQWKRHHYDVKTFPVLTEGEIVSHAFALLNKCSRVVSEFESSSKKRDFYFICLQDHLILKAIERDKELRLLPLLIYIFTHELVHIVRFSNFLQRFHLSDVYRAHEEKIVHLTTFDILKDLSLSGMDYILEAYQRHRICSLAMS